MLYFAFKAAISAIPIALVSTLARRYPCFAALVASLLLTSVIGMVWLWAEKPDAENVAAHAGATFRYVLPSLPLFLLILVLLRYGVGFWVALLAGCRLRITLYSSQHCCRSGISSARACFDRVPSEMFRRWLRSGGLMTMLVVGYPAGAQQVTQDGTAPPAAGIRQADNRNQSGSHDGTAPPAAERSAQESPAVDLSMVYTGEVWSNRRGGLRRGERYLDNLDVTLTVDAERALGWQGVTLFAYGLYNNGAAFSGDLVGDAQTISNIETGVRAARLYEVWIDKRFAGDHASIRFGLYDLNSEFDTTEAGQLSLLSSHGIGPEFAQSGLNGPSIFPNTSLALRAEYKLDDRWTVRAAVLDGVPGDPAHPQRTAVKLSSRDGALLVGEVAYVDRDTKAGIGVWRYTSCFDGQEVSTEAGIERRADNGGVYLLVEHGLIRTDADWADDGVKPGLSGFLRLGFAQDRINPIGRYFGGGLVHTGLIRRGRDDQLGLTFARASYGRPYLRSLDAPWLRSDRAETVLEVTYRTPLTPWLTIQPDVQYVFDPSGDASLREALAIGLRAEVGF